MKPHIPVPLNQAWPKRVLPMTEMIQTFQGPIHALEVGTWYGLGSTQIWMEHLKPGSTLTLIDPWRPYSSPEDLADPGWDYAAVDAMTLEAYMSTILAVRNFERANPNKLSINILRGDSEHLMGQMRDGCFDFIFIDGDHKYPSVSRNIRDAKRLARNDYSVVCGDDLEHLPTPELMKIAMAHPHLDCYRDPHHFHPGVMRAVAEEFEQVGMESAFWWVFKSNGKFTLG